VVRTPATTPQAELASRRGSRPADSWCAVTGSCASPPSAPRRGWARSALRWPEAQEPPTRLQRATAPWSACSAPPPSLLAMIAFLAHGLLQRGVGDGMLSALTLASP
jgi:hypothetical protein